MDTYLSQPYILSSLLSSITIDAIGALISDPENCEEYRKIFSTERNLSLLSHQFGVPSGVAVSDIDTLLSEASKIVPSIRSLEHYSTVDVFYDSLRDHPEVALRLLQDGHAVPKMNLRQIMNIAKLTRNYELSVHCLRCLDGPLLGAPNNGLSVEILSRSFGSVADGLKLQISCICLHRPSIEVIDMTYIDRNVLKECANILVRSSREDLLPLLGKNITFSTQEAFVNACGSGDLGTITRLLPTIYESDEDEDIDAIYDGIVLCITNGHGACLTHIFSVVGEDIKHETLEKRIYGMESVLNSSSNFQSLLFMVYDEEVCKHILSLEADMGNGQLRADLCGVFLRQRDYKAFTSLVTEPVDILYADCINVGGIIGKRCHDYLYSLRPPTPEEEITIKDLTLSIAHISM
jgi:hypothetical protein